MKKTIDTKEYGKVVAVEFCNPQKLGGSHYLALTKYLPDFTQVRVIVLDSNDKKTTLVIEKVEA